MRPPIAITQGIRGALSEMPNARKKVFPEFKNPILVGWVVFLDVFMGLVALVISLSILRINQRIRLFIPK